MSAFREDERNKQPEKPQLSDQPHEDLLNRAALDIERNYQSQMGSEGAESALKPVDLSALPPNFVGKPLRYIAVVLPTFEYDDSLDD